MGFNISKLKGDSALENEGVWVDEKDGLRLKIARLGNAAYRKHLRGLITQQKSKLSHFRVHTDIDAIEERTKEAVAKHVLMDWENLDYANEDGTVDKDVSFSSERALKLFDEFPEFYDIVVEYASDMSLFREESQEEAEKN